MSGVVAQSEPPHGRGDVVLAGEPLGLSLTSLLVEMGEPALAVDGGRVMWGNLALCDLLGYEDVHQLLGQCLENLVVAHGADDELALRHSSGRAVAVEVTAGLLEELGAPQLVVLRPAACGTKTECELLRQLTIELSSADEDAVPRCLERIGEHFAMDIVVVARVSQLEDQYELEHAWSRHGEVAVPFRSALAQTFAGVVAAKQRPITINDTAAPTHPDYAGREAFGKRSYVGVPLSVEGGVYGALELHGRASMFSTQQLGLLQLCADWVGSAIERKQRVSELRVARCQLEELVRTDPLTRLPNRKSILETAHREVLRSRRYQAPLCIALLDLDHFKQINEGRGHAAADQLLKRVAGVLQSCLREVDIVGRYGGDAFMLLLPNTSALAAIVPAQRVLNALRDIADEQDVTASIGLVRATPNESLDVLLEHAEGALAEAKRLGRNQFAIFQEPDAE